MRPFRRLLPPATLTTPALLATNLHADDTDRLWVGIQPDGRIVVPTNQIPDEKPLNRIL
jgi:hypothetical protein